MMEGPEMASLLKRYVAGRMDWKQLAIALEERLDKIKSE